MTELGVVIQECTRSGTTRGWSSRTIQSYSADLDRFQQFLQKTLGMNAVSLDSIQTTHVRQFMESLPGLSPSTRNRKLSAISSLFEYGVERGYLISNPARAMRRERRRRKRAPCPTVDEVLKMWSHTSGTLERAAFKLLAILGLRRSETASLRLDSVDVDNATLKVLGKGEKERMLPTSPEVLAAVREYLEDRPAATGDGALFLDPSGVPIGSKSICSMVRRWVRLAGLSDKGYSPHSLRHFAATRMLECGVPLHHVREALGHESTETTDWYLHSSTGDLARAFARSLPPLLERDQSPGNHLLNDEATVNTDSRTAEIASTDAEFTLVDSSRSPSQDLVIRIPISEGMFPNGGPKRIRIDVEIH